MPQRAEKTDPVLQSRFYVNLVLNQSASPPQQYSRSKDQDAAEDREKLCTAVSGNISPSLPHD